MAYDFTGDCIDGTTNPQIMIGGHIPSYQIREVQSIRILRLKERAAERDQELFLAFMEADGGLLNAGTFPVKAMCNHGGTLGRVRFAPPAKNRGNLTGRPSDLDEGALVDDDLNEIDPSSPPAKGHGGSQGRRLAGDQGSPEKVSPAPFSFGRMF